MRRFSVSEQQTLRELAVLAGNAVPAVKFMQDHYFASQSGRALIVQAQAHRAVFFMDPSVFADTQKNAASVKAFIELISLLNYLAREGYITFYREKTEPMYFFQEDFQGPKNVNNSIVLNSRGDYTSVPDTIHDKDNNVIYKGIIFNTDVFDMILNTTTGTLIISENINELFITDTMEEEIPETAQEEKETVYQRLSISNVIAIAIGTISILTHVLLAIYMHDKTNDYDENFRQLSARHDKLRSSVEKGFASLGNAMPPADLPATSENDEPDIHLYGVDISKWNGDEAAEIGPNDSISFIICKATEGMREVDRDLARNWQTIRDKQCLLGAYHFYVVGEDPIVQAEHFWNTISSHGTTDITPVVDIELKSIRGNLKQDKVTIQKHFRTFLEHLEKLCGRMPMIYTSNAFAGLYLTDPFFGKYALWLADYTNAHEPHIPEAWKGSGYKIWQKRDNYFIDSHTTDFDIYYGKRSGLIR